MNIEVKIILIFHFGRCKTKISVAKYSAEQIIKKE